MTIFEFQKHVHKTAVEKGWWESGDRNYGEICSLFHSEISEAYDEFFCGMVNVYYNDDKPKKPEGALVELADFGIRVFDYAGFHNIHMENLMEDADYIICQDADKLCLIVHKYISESFELYRKHKSINEYMKPIASALNTIFIFTHDLGKEFITILKLKALYNETRSYRHGNKKA